MVIASRKAGRCNKIASAVILGVIALLYGPLLNATIKIKGLYAELLIGQN